MDYFVKNGFRDNQVGVCITGSPPRKLTLTKNLGTTKRDLSAIPTALTLVLFALSIVGVGAPRAVATGATVGLCLFCLITGFSIGLLYVPAALFSVLALVLRPARQG